MKVIDLINKIANGKELPKKFKFKNNHHTFELIKYQVCGVDVMNYKDEEDDYLIGSEYELLLILNDELEIIEDKKIEKCKGYECFECLDDYIEHLRHKIDELIKEIEKLKESK